MVALPGHPAGEPLDRVEGYAAWLAGALTEVAAPRALVGHGLGAAIALTVARERPDLVDGLVLMGIGPTLPVADDALRRAGTDFPAEAERLVASSLAGADARARERALALVTAAGAASLAADYAACRAFDAAPWLGEVPQPTLVVAGAGDTVTPVAGGEVVARSLPAALMAVVPEAGHLTMVEGAQAVNLLLAGYLARLELTLGDGD